MDREAQRDQTSVVSRDAASSVDASALIQDFLADMTKSRLSGMGKTDMKQKLRAAIEKLSKLVDIHDDDDSKVLGQQPPDGLFLPNGTWTNWSSSVKPKKLPPHSRPKAIKEVQAVVKAAAAANKPVRCVGQAHSWTPVFYDEGTSHVLFMGDLVLNASGDRILLERRADASAGIPARVRVAPGVATGELGQWMEEHSADVGCTGLTAEVILNTVRYGGVISMACHGTGKDTATVPDYIVGLQWIDADGEIQELTREAAMAAGSDAATEFNCLVAGLGLLGVVTAIVFELDGELDKPYVDVVNVFEPMGKALKGPLSFQRLVEDNFAVEIFWMPLNSAEPGLDLRWNASNWNPQEDDSWIIKFKNRVMAKREDVQQFENRAGVIERTQTELGAVVARLSQEGRKSKLLLQAWQGKLAVEALKINLEVPFGFLSDGIKSLPKAIHYQKYITKVKVYDVEVCFPVAEDFGNVWAAWNAAVDIAAAEIKKGGRNVMNVALECRFTRGSDAVLSPAYKGAAGQGGSQHEGWYCWIEVLASASTPLDAWLLFVDKVLDAWRAIKHPGPVRLHWAKWTDFDKSKGNVEAQLAEKLVKHTQDAYKEQFVVFRNVVQKLDPNGRFQNKWLGNLLQLPSPATPLQPSQPTGGQ